MNQNQFDLNYQWKLYLKRVGFKEEDLSPIQLQETKRAFYAGCGQLLFLLRDEVSKHDDEKAFDILDGMKNQIANFWLAETNKQN